MANVTVRDVVRQIGQCHAALAALYSGLAATASGERVRMLAQALAAREDRLVQTTARYQGDEASIEAIYDEMSAAFGGSVGVGR